MKQKQEQPVIEECKVDDMDMMHHLLHERIAYIAVQEEEERMREKALDAEGQRG